MTIFKEISHFNELIGNRRWTGTDEIRGQLAMIREEFDELSESLERLCAGLDGISAGDCRPEECFGSGGYRNGLLPVRDGIADVLVTTYGLAHRLGVDADADLRKVQDSNMSKFVRGDALAAGTEAERVARRLSVQVSIAETAPGVWAITSKRDQHGSDGKFYPTGKLLKPSTYFEPEFD